MENCSCISVSVCWKLFYVIYCQLFSLYSLSIYFLYKYMLFGVCLFEYNITHIITEWALTGRRLVLYEIKQHSKSSLFQQLCGSVFQCDFICVIKCFPFYFPSQLLCVPNCCLPAFLQHKKTHISDVLYQSSSLFSISLSYLIFQQTFYILLFGSRLPRWLCISARG